MPEYPYRDNLKAEIARMRSGKPSALLMGSENSLVAEMFS